MRDILIILAILLIIILGTLLINTYLNNTTQPLINNLEEIKNNIENHQISEAELADKIDKIYKDWSNINLTWSNIILHEEIDSIETSLIKAKTKIKIGEFEESIEDIETTIFLVNHIREKEKTNLKNIF